MPESLTASSATMSANLANRSSLRLYFRSKWLSKSRFFTSQANWVLNLEASKRVIGAEPLFPFKRPSQYSCALFPIGVSAPIPVTTTRFNSMLFVYLLTRLACVLFNILYSFTNGGNVFCLIVWYSNVEFLFEFHN